MSLKNVEDIYPLSPLQESLLHHAMAAPGSAAGFEQKSTTFEGDLDGQLMEQAWRRVVERHAILRTAFISERLPRPMQVVRRRVELPFQHFDWSELEPELQERHHEELLAADRQRGFEPHRAPLMRLALVRLGDDRFQLIWSYHHLLLDAWCRNLVLQEVFTLYAGLRGGREPALPASRPYREYIAWIGRQDNAELLRFWRRKLGDWLEPTPLVVDRLGDAEAPRGAYDERQTTLNAEELSLLGDYARRHGLTLGTLVQGAWALLLARYSARAEVVFGITVSGRPAELPGVENMVGLFVNNLPVRLAVPMTAAPAEWLAAVQADIAELRQYEHSSPVEIQDCSAVADRRRLYDTLVLYQNVPAQVGEAPPSAADSGQAAAPVTLTVRDLRGRLQTGYPLTLVANPGDDLRLRAFYDAGRFAGSTLERLLGHLSQLLVGLAADGPGCLGELALLSPAEQRQMTVEWPEATGARPVDGRGQPLPVGITGLLEGSSCSVGELGRWLADGELQRLGRVEDRLWLAGQEIHLTEVEALLAQYPQPAEWAMALWQDDPPAGEASASDGRLVVFCTAAEAPVAAAVRSFVERSLPPFMAPTALVPIERIPRRPSGAVERSALPTAQAARHLARPAYVAPRDLLELRLLEIWQHLFDSTALGVTDDFFDLGGHSILAVRLMGEIRSRLGQDMPLTALLGGATVEALAKTLRQRGLTEVAESGDSSLVEIQPHGSRPPLFCVHAGGGGILSYVDLAYCLGGDQPVYGLKAPGWQDQRQPIDRVEALAKHHLESLEGVAGAGPYRLIGWSYGGLVAYEMAQQLRRAGQRVELVGVLDAAVLGRRQFDDTEILMQFLGDYARPYAEQLRELGDIEQQIDFLLREASEHDLLPADFDPVEVRRLFYVRRSSFVAGFAYQPQPYDGTVTLFRADSGRRLHYEDQALGWQALARGGLDLVDVPGSHEDMLTRPFVETLALRLRERLDNLLPPVAEVAQATGAGSAAMSKS